MPGVPSFASVGEGGREGGEGVREARRERERGEPRREGGGSSGERETRSELVYLVKLSAVLLVLFLHARNKQARLV